MAKAEATVDELVGMIERGELRLPEMQRHYVWKAPRVRDLLDSLYRGYPSGAILVWETDEVVPVRDFAVQQQSSPYASTRLLLDGQQRLTSLSAVIRGQPVKVRGRKKPIELLFNLDHPDDLVVVTEVKENDNDDDGAEDLLDDEMDSTEDELQQRFNRMTFLVATKKQEQLPHWVRVTDVFQTDSDRDFLKRAGVTSLDDPRGEKYSQRLARLRGIKKYVYRMDVLERGLSYDEVTEIFVRVNSLGAKLRSSDLALAQITAKWRGALKVFQEAQGRCAKAGFELELGIVLKNLVAFATGQSRFQSVGRLPLDLLKSMWKESVDGLDFAINFVKSNAQLDSPALMSSPFLLVTLAYYGRACGYEVPPDEEQELRKWVLIANAKGRYSRGSTETLLDQDLAAIRVGGRAQELLDRLRLQVGRLDITADELEGRNRRSALFKTMFLAFREAGARDWRSNLAISLNHRGNKHRLQFHHIFPKALLKRSGHSARDADDIANFAFIGGKTNRQISDREPAQYLCDLVEKWGPKPFEAQCIPTERSLLGTANYEDFLLARRKLVAKRLNEFLGTTEEVG